MHLITPLGTDVFFDVRIQQMGKLAVVSHQHDAALGQSHRNEQIQWIGSCRFVDHHAGELHAGHGIASRILQFAHLAAG